MCIAYIGKAAITAKSQLSSSEFLNIQKQVKFSPPTAAVASASSSSASPEQKRVRFTEEPPQVVCTIKPSSLLTEEEKQQVYWQNQDYDNFRGTARIIASEVLKISFTQPPKIHSYDVVLTKVYQACGSSTTSTNGSHSNSLFSSSSSSCQEDEDEDCTSLLGMNANACSTSIHTYTTETTSTSRWSNCDSQDAFDSDTVPIPSSLFTALSHWIKAGHSRRGLEKFCVPHHIKVRSAERSEITKMILMTQDLLKDVRIHHPNEKVFKVGTHEFSLLLPDDEILRMVSERFTRPSVKYAVTMGHADAAAVGNYPLEGLSLSTSSSPSSLSCGSGTK